MHVHVHVHVHVHAQPATLRAQPATLHVQVVFYSEPLRFDAQGTQSLAKMTRHRQGVVVSFRSAGQVYAFYWQYFINELLAGYLFLTPTPTLTPNPEP